MSLFKRILGLFRAEPAPVPARAAPAAATTPVAEVPVAPRELALSWQEMLDHQSRIAGYLLRPTPLRAGSQPSGAALHAALMDEGVRRLTERRKAVLPITPTQWLAADFRDLLTPNTYCLLQAEPGTDGAVLLACARDIVAASGQLAVDSQTALDLPPDLPPAMVVFDQLGLSLEALEARVTRLRREQPATLLVVDQVNSWPEYRMFRALGVQLCLGPFATVPDSEEATGRISQSRLVLIELLNLLRRDAEGAELAAVAKRDPAVVLKLIEMANSPLSGLGRRIVDLEDAIVVLGREALYRWLALSMYRLDGQGGRDETLMAIALSRAAFLESLAPETQPQQGAELFLVGLFSLLDSLLRVPLAQILGRMLLPEAVADVLLRNEGPYARYLMLAHAMERCQLPQALSLCTLIGLDHSRMLACYSQAMTWATTEIQP